MWSVCPVTTKVSGPPFSSRDRWALPTPEQEQQGWRRLTHPGEPKALKTLGMVLKPQGTELMTRTSAVECKRALLSRVVPGPSRVRESHLPNCLLPLVPHSPPLA
jgi:hypothetical protein